MHPVTTGNKTQGRLQNHDIVLKWKAGGNETQDNPKQQTQTADKLNIINLTYIN